MSKSLAKILMYITGTYALLGYGLLLLWFTAIMLSLVLGEISLFPSPLQNMITLIESLIANGFIGLITALILVGQFFFSYHLHNVFNRLSKIDGPYSIQEHEEYITYLILAALLIIYLFFIWIERWCRHQELNSGPDDYKSTALPTELYRQKKIIIYFL